MIGRISDARWYVSRRELEKALEPRGLYLLGPSYSHRAGGGCWFCPHCGRDLPETAEIDRDVITCSHCGRLFVVADEWGDEWGEVRIEGLELRCDRLYRQHRRQLATARV
jgi:hypothetical protein